MVMSVDSFVYTSALGKYNNYLKKKKFRRKPPYPIPKTPHPTRNTQQILAFLTLYENYINISFILFTKSQFYIII